MILQNCLSAKVLTTISLVILISLFSCKDNEIESGAIKTGLYLKKYMNYPSHVYPLGESSDFTYVNVNIGSTTKSDTIFIEYYKDKIIKRIGWYHEGHASTGFFSIFSKDVYDTLIYTNNQLTILTKSKSPSISGVAAYKKVIYYKNGRISKTVQSYQYTYDRDITVDYTYTNNLLTKKIGYRGTDLYFQSDLYYNNNSNLDSIITRESRYNFDTETREIDFSSPNRTKETFENYDNNKNPLSSFIVFDETFNRALSANNYKKYNYYYFVTDDRIMNDWHFTYNFQYDHGFINFGR